MRILQILCVVHIHVVPTLTFPLLFVLNLQFYVLQFHWFTHNNFIM
jgi:hypothetical protein